MKAYKYMTRQELLELLDSGKISSRTKFRIRAFLDGRTTGANNPKPDPYEYSTGKWV